MGNPILQNMNRPSKITNLMQLIKGDPNGMYENMIKTNPQFAQFVRENKGKTPEQIARENGIDFNLVKQLMR